MTTRSALALIAALALLGGCSAPTAAAPSTSAPTPSMASPSPVSATPSPSATTPSPSPTTPKAMKIGDTIDLGAVSLQLLEAKHIPKGYRDGPAYGIRIKACNKQPAGSHPPGFTGDPWVIVDAEDGQYERSNSLYDSDPVPQFPQELRETKPGRCVQGWIVYEIPATSTKIARVEYSSDAGQGEWTV